VPIVTRLDQMGRSARHLIDVAGELGERGVELIVLPGRPADP
jgi:DNA invertase Pin-like site-specific DNA recombinase